MASSYIGVGVYFLLGIAFVAGTLGASWLLRPHHPHPEKLATYECGERPVGPPWFQFRIVFYVFALAFVIFDVEIVYLFPWAVVLKDLTNNQMGWFAIVEMLVFVAILLVGWLFALRRGAFDWE